MLKTAPLFCQNEKPRVIVTTDGEADDRASMVRFLLMANEFEVEGIINSSSQFHWLGGQGWNAFHSPDWVQEYIGHYAQVYEQLKKHDPGYPSPEHLLSVWKVGNISAVGEDEIRTEGAEWIAEVLLRDDPRAIWLQAWGGCNTIARALKIIQEDHPEKMEEVAGRIRLFLIWEQDESYQTYIRPNWEYLGFPVIISDQFDCMAYIWEKVLPEQVKPFFQAEWMKEHILNGHGPLCDLYENRDGAFNAEGDTPAFLHGVPNGLRSTENPGFGGWGGRYERLRNNVWVDPLPDSTFVYPEGQRSIHNSWSKQMEHDTIAAKCAMRTRYFRPIWRWMEAVQQDFAARADWCVKGYASANHHPQVRLKNTPLFMEVKAGKTIRLDASPSTDPDGDELHFNWWHYSEAGSYRGEEISGKRKAKAKLRIPGDAKPGDTIHFVCEVKDAGEPVLTRYQRVVVRVIDN